jgi:hypothetical protein
VRRAGRVAVEREERSRQPHAFSTLILQESS